MRKEELDIEEVRSRLKIDRLALDDMLVEQPQHFFEVANLYSIAVAEKDDLKEKLQRVDSEVAARLRNEAETAGRKITETAIGQLILVSEEHMHAVDEYNKARLRSEQLGAVKEAFAQRAYMLRDLVQLYLGGYFSENSVRGQTAAAEQAATQVRRNQMSSQRQRLTT